MLGDAGSGRTLVRNDQPCRRGSDSERRSVEHGSGNTAAGARWFGSDSTRCLNASRRGRVRLAASKSRRDERDTDTTLDSSEPSIWTKDRVCLRVMI